jgi:hypothetical protein
MKTSTGPAGTFTFIAVGLTLAFIAYGMLGGGKRLSE